MTITCGFIGLGNQGAPMARRIIEAGFPTIVWDRRPEALEPFRGTAARCAATIAALAPQVDHAGICVLNDDDVREVCGQLIPLMRPGSRVAIHSTVHPSTCRVLAEEAAGRNVRVVDAAVSGGAPAAASGTLTLMVGGDAADLEATRPVFETFAKVIVHFGAVGTGQQAKLINNTLFAANLGMAHHAVIAGEHLGIERSLLLELLMASSGRSFAVETLSRLPTPTAFARGGTLLEKDVRLLGEVLGESQPFRALSSAALPFLDLVRGKAEG